MKKKKKSCAHAYSGKWVEPFRWRALSCFDVTNLLQSHGFLPVWCGKTVQSPAKTSLASPAKTPVHWFVSSFLHRD